MTLTYIYHSGFLIETPDYAVIIDYYEDSSNRNSGVISELLKTNQKLYILSTHSHKDHFNPEILTWKELHPEIQFVFSKEILDEGLAKEDAAVYLDKLEVFADNNIQIQAFGSTDTGGSFLIKSMDKTIFHAGDLNNWHWKDEVGAEEAMVYETNFLNELALLSEHIQKIDIAMFPVDPRLGKEYMLGAKQFADAIEISLFCPMHFGEQYHKANALESYIEGKGGKFFAIQKRGDSITF